MNVLRRVHRCLVSGGVLLDLQPNLSNAPVVDPQELLGRLDESEFCAYADRVNAALGETIEAGLFAVEGEAFVDVVHRFDGASALVAEVATWRGTSIPPSLRARLERAQPPLDVREGARLRRLRARSTGPRPVGSRNP